MSAFNMTTFLGWIASDLTLTTVGSGQNAFSVLRFRLAVPRRLSKSELQDKKNGQQVRNSAYVPVEATGANADNIAKFFQKGSHIAIVGRYEDYVIDKPGQQKTYGHKIILESFDFVPKPFDNASSGQQPRGNATSAPTNNYYEASPDDMPF